jgi:SAM-dependent methyltransferase
MFEELNKINSRPKLYEFYTSEILWNDGYTSQRMLDFHLNGSIDVASRNTKFIDRSAEWIASLFNVNKKTRIADFGCGPGLYTTRFAEKGAVVTGIDFSERSIQYAKEVATKNRLTIDYVLSNYLEFDSEQKFDLIFMIMCDFCALSPAQRKTMICKFDKLLDSGGSVLLDVYALKAFDQREEARTYDHKLLNGFWSSKDYYGFLNTFKYDKDKVILDKYTIIEESRTRVIYNWLQYFSLESLKKEFEENNFKIDECFSDVSGTLYDEKSSEFAVVAKRS